jgi:hypothetical protein
MNCTECGSSIDGEYIEVSHGQKNTIYHIFCAKKVFEIIRKGLSIRYGSGCGIQQTTPPLFAREIDWL